MCEVEFWEVLFARCKGFLHGLLRTHVLTAE